MRLNPIVEFRTASRVAYTYGHYLESTLIYIGSGVGNRAVSFSNRKYPKEGVVIKLLGVYDTREEASIAEDALIEKYLPQHNAGTGYKGRPVFDTSEEGYKAFRNAKKLIYNRKLRSTPEGRAYTNESNKRSRDNIERKGMAKEATRAYRATPEGREASNEAARKSRAKRKALTEALLT